MRQTVAGDAKRLGLGRGRGVAVDSRDNVHVFTRAPMLRSA